MTNETTKKELIALSRKSFKVLMGQLLNLSGYEGDGEVFDPSLYLDIILTFHMTKDLLYFMPVDAEMNSILEPLYKMLSMGYDPADPREMQENCDDLIDYLKNTLFKEIL